MRTKPSQLKPSQLGFTLIEIILSVVVLSIAAISVVPLFGQLGESLVLNRDVQAAAQLSQECAEHLLAARREFGYAMNGINNCAGLAAFNGFGPPTVVVSEPFVGAACPGGNCKMFQIDANYGSGTSVVTLVVVEY